MAMRITVLSKTKVYIALSLTAVVLTLLNQALIASAYAPDEDLMHVKGYSPEVIQIANQQRNRQEWKEPTVPSKGPVEKFLHNIYYGDWIGPVDDFGSGVIRKE